MFTSLGVASPNSISLQIPFVSPSAQPLRVDEVIEVNITPTSVIREETTLTQTSEQRTGAKSPEERSGLRETQRLQLPKPPTWANSTQKGDAILPGLTPLPPIPRLQTSQFQFSQYLTPTLLGDAAARVSTLLGEPTVYETGTLGLEETADEDSSSREFTGDNYPSLKVTRQEILKLTSDLGRIPHSFISGEGMDVNQRYH